MSTPRMRPRPRRRRRTPLVGIGALVAVLGGAVALAPLPDPSLAPLPDPRGVIVASDLADGRESLSTIPWGDVGEGWFLIGYEMDPVTNPDGSGYGTGPDDFTLLSPTGARYEVANLGAMEPHIAYWNGTETWLTNADPSPLCDSDEDCSSLAYDLASGTVGPAGIGTYEPGRVVEAVGGTLLEFGGCCCTEFVRIVEPAAASTSLASISCEGSLVLSPEGSTVIVSEVGYTDHGNDEYTYSTTISELSLDGSSRAISAIDGLAPVLTILPDGSMITWALDTPHHEQFSVNRTTGALSAWDSPRPELELMGRVDDIGLSWRDPASEDRRVIITDFAGATIVDYSWMGPCPALTSGTTVLTHEEAPWNPNLGDTLDRVGRQTRLTLVDTVTGQQTALFDGLIHGWLSSLDHPNDLP